jgi:uncharacterized protein YprB with RNaseH-like and TPR domain
MKPTKPRIILWDLETSNLRANFGYILCAGWKVLGEKKIHVISIADSPTFENDPTNDKWVVKEMAKVLESADVWVTHYGVRFDAPYMRTRLMGHGLKTLPPIPHVDTWKIARYQMALNSNRLASIAGFLELDEKTPIKGQQWVKAMAGNKRALNYVVKHCRQDVHVLEQVYLQLRPLMTNHPNINLIDGKQNACPKCGTVGKMQKRGHSIAGVSRYQRYQCMKCGGWSRGKPVRIKSIDIR